MLQTDDNDGEEQNGNVHSDVGLISLPPTCLKTQSRLMRIVSGVDKRDVDTAYRIEKRDNENGVSFASTLSHREPYKIISWDDEDVANPYNWSPEWKAFIVLIGMVIVINSTMGSSLPSNAIPVLCEYFEIESSYAKVLPISTYLIGYILGPLFFGPLSEACGRKFIITASFVAFTVFTLACALAPCWESFLFFRFATGVNASAPIAVVGGVYADIYGNPISRGRALAVFTGGTCVGPLIAPIISGYVAPAMGWRWVFWIGLIIAGSSLPFLFALPETYGPVLLAKRAARLRKITGDDTIVAPMELEDRSWKQLATITLTRPIRMICFELIVLATCLYLSLAYGIFYMYFTAYPLVFEGIYHLSSGACGLMFLPIGIGAIFASMFFLWYDGYLLKAQARGAAWTRKEESRRLPLACIGGPCYVVALLWLGWTSRESIHFLVPAFAGVPFGFGFILIFIALLNYLTDAYQIFAASSMAAASCCRSIAGVVLPFAAAPMYRDLGINWGSSLLAFLSLGMCAVPFCFMWKGDSLREGSKFCTYLREKQEKEELERKQDAELRSRQLSAADADVEKRG